MDFETTNVSLAQDEDQTLSQALIESLGWSWPPLTGKASPDRLPEEVIDTFKAMDPTQQYRILSFGKERRRTGQSRQELELLYQSTWALRQTLIDVLAQLHAPAAVDPCADQFREMDGFSELAWLQLRYESWASELTEQGISRKKSEEIPKKIDYPVGITFTAIDPLERDGPLIGHHPRAEQHRIDCAKVPKEGYWLLGFQDCPQPFHHINFHRTHPLPNVRLSPHVATLGLLWFEDPDQCPSLSSQHQPGEKEPPHYLQRHHPRVMFQKMASEDDLALFVWPQFQAAHIPSLTATGGNLPETPKIPVYQDDVVQICDEDRFLLLTSSYRSHRIHVSLQIKIAFEWASSSGSNSNSNSKTSSNASDNGAGRQRPMRETRNGNQRLAKDPEDLCRKVNQDQDRQLISVEEKQVGVHSEWILGHELWPNPAERYSHYVKRPLIFPVNIEGAEGASHEGQGQGSCTIRLMSTLKKADRKWWNETREEGLEEAPPVEDNEKEAGVGGVVGEVRLADIERRTEENGLMGLDQEQLKKMPKKNSQLEESPIENHMQKEDPLLPPPGPLRGTTAGKKRTRSTTEEDLMNAPRAPMTVRKSSRVGERVNNHQIEVQEATTAVSRNSDKGETLENHPGTTGATTKSRKRGGGGGGGPQQSAPGSFAPKASPANDVPPKKPSSTGKQKTCLQEQQQQGGGVNTRNGHRRTPPTRNNKNNSTPTLSGTTNNATTTQHSVNQIPTSTSSTVTSGKISANNGPDGQSSLERRRTSVRKLR